MRPATAVIAAFLAIAMGACTRHDTESAERRAQRERDANSAAHKAGRAAYAITQETKEAARKAGQKIREASREMREGWSDAKHDAREKSKK